MAEDDVVYNASSTISLDEETERLEENTGNGGNVTYAYLKEGKTQVRIVGDVQEDSYEGDEQVKIPVEPVKGELAYRDQDGNEHTVSAEDDVDGDVFLTFRRGSTKNSTWGRIVQVAEQEGGFEDLELTILRSGTGTDTSYTLMEYVEMQDEE